MSIFAENEKLIEKVHPSRWFHWQIYFAAGLAAIFALALIILPTIYGTVGNLPIKIFGDFQKSFLFTIFIVFLFILGPLLVGFAELIRIAHTYYITDKRIIESFSFLSRRLASTQYSRIQNIEIRQSLVERIVGIGDLEIYTAGYAMGNRPEIAFRGIKNPFQIKKFIVEFKLKETPGSKL